jgi:hypothetical protein
MAHKHTRARPHAALRHRSQIPMPAVEAGEQRLMDVRSPSLLAPRQPHRRIRMRQRRLTLPVMVAILVRVVWRRVPSIAEGQQVLAPEGLLGGAPLRVSPQAIGRITIQEYAIRSELSHRRGSLRQNDLGDGSSAMHWRWHGLQRRSELFG